jgi:sodium transport system ATP-binding protein
VTAEERGAAAPAVCGSIAVRGATKRFHDAVAVEDLTFEVRPGEIYGLIGPNGAGKTTTLRMLAGLMRPSAGSLEVCGHDVTLRPMEARASLGILTGSTALYARLTVLEVLRYFGALYGLPRPTVARRVEELSRTFGFEAILGRRCGSLSTGERQRVSLARATLHDPAVLILDEPTAGLDVLASRFVADFIRTARASGRAILFSTHYMAEAELLCDRIGLLHRGRLLREGTPAELRAGTAARSLEEAFLLLVTTSPPVEGSGGSERGAT